MNCKQGDIAVLVRNLIRLKAGAIVTCVEFKAETLAWNKVFKTNIVVRNVWVVDIKPENPRCAVTVIEDRFLRPLRNNDGQDQTLTWAGLPGKVKA